MYACFRFNSDTQLYSNIYVLFPPAHNILLIIVVYRHGYGTLSFALFECLVIWFNICFFYIYKNLYMFLTILLHTYFFYYKKKIICTDFSCSVYYALNLIPDCRFSNSCYPAKDVHYQIFGKSDPWDQLFLAVSKNPVTCKLTFIHDSMPLDK